MESGDLPADLFDKSLIPLDPGLGRFLEELLESNAALLMLESAVRGLPLSRHGRENAMPVQGD